MQLLLNEENEIRFRCLINEVISKLRARDDRSAGIAIMAVSTVNRAENMTRANLVSFFVRIGSEE